MSFLGWNLAASAAISFLDSRGASPRTHRKMRQLSNARHSMDTGPSPVNPKSRSRTETGAGRPPRVSGKVVGPELTARQSHRVPMIVWDSTGEFEVNPVGSLAVRSSDCAPEALPHGYTGPLRFIAPFDWTGRPFINRITRLRTSSPRKGADVWFINWGHLKKTWK